MSDYTMTVTLDLAPDEAERRIREALADEGFGILSEIDVEHALREKLGEEIGHYRILGACNPALAHRALGVDRSIGALLPCNVVLRAGAGGGTEVVAADPQRMLDVAGDPGLDDLAAEARERIGRALGSVAAS